MMIKSIAIRNFKGLKEVSVDACGTINAIVGKNNSGKSSVLHALDMAGLALSLNGWDRFQPKLDVKDLFADVGQFAMSLTYDDGSAVELTANPSYGPTFTPTPTATQKLKTVLVLPDVHAGMNRRRHHTPKTILDQVDARNYAEVNALEILYAIKFYSARNERGLTPDSYTTLLDEVRKYFPDIDDLQSDRSEDDIATLTYSEYGKKLDILYSGTGLKHFLDVLLKTTVSGAKVVLLDEPELGLHPDLQRRFVEYLTRLAKEQQIQFFLATHSQVLLNYADSMVYYRITNTKGSRSLVRVDKEAVDTLLADLGLRPSDVLNQDICLLVEGATDVVFFEHVLRTLYAAEFQRLAIAVLQYAGAAADGIVSGAIDVSNIVPAQKHTYWIRDRDASPSEIPSSSSTKFLNALNKKGIDGRIWNKREIEYYFPEPLLIAAQQGDANKVQRVLEIVRGKQADKFHDAATKYGVCVPSGKYLRTLLLEHVTSRDQLDPDVREVVEKQLLPWRDSILGA